MSCLFVSVPNDVLFTMDQFLNSVDRFYLRGVCTRFRKYFQEQKQPSVNNLIEYGYLDLIVINNIIEKTSKDLINICAIYGKLDIRSWAAKPSENIY